MEQLQQTKRNPMATASLTFGGLAILFAFRIPLYALFFGCLSILFAILSRGSGLKMPDRALIGLIISIFAIVIAIIFFIATLYLQQYLIQKYGADVVQNPETLQKLLEERMNNLINQLQTGGSEL